VHHAQARTCRIRFAVVNADSRPALRVEICDDGIGLPAEQHVGVGITSMRERAAELGGTCMIGPAPGGGTQVCAQLPIPSVEY
jgi:two-component system NarL family sensor kinase